MCEYKSIELDDGQVFLIRAKLESPLEPPLTIQEKILLELSNKLDRIKEIEYDSFSQGCGLEDL